MSKSLCLDNLRRKDSWFTLHPYIEEAGTSKCLTFVFIKLLKNHKWQSITLSNCQDIYQDCFSVAYSGWTKNFGKLTSGLYHSANTSHYFFAKLEIIFFAQKTNVDFVSHFFLHQTKGSLWYMYRMNDYIDSTPIRKKMGKICENGAKPLI